MAPADGVPMVTLVVSPAARIVLTAQVPWHEGMTIADALAACDLQAQCANMDLTHASAGIWGRPKTRSQSLQPDDRVEFYRPLTVDPKEARRLRYRAQKPKRKLLQVHRARPTPPVNGNPS